MMRQESQRIGSRALCHDVRVGAVRNCSLEPAGGARWKVHHLVPTGGVVLAGVAGVDFVLRVGVPVVKPGRHVGEFVCQLFDHVFEDFGGVGREQLADLIFELSEHVLQHMAFGGRELDRCSAAAVGCDDERK